MRKFLLGSVLLGSAVALMLTTGCGVNSSGQTTVTSGTTAATVVVKGQEFCAKATADGPLVVALLDAFGAPVTVTGLPSSVVAANCNLIGGIVVSPPANPATAPVVTAPAGTTSGSQPVQVSMFVGANWSK